MRTETNGRAEARRRRDAAARAIGQAAWAEESKGMYRAMVRDEMGFLFDEAKALPNGNVAETIYRNARIEAVESAMGKLGLPVPDGKTR